LFVSAANEVSGILSILEVVFSLFAHPTIAVATSAGGAAPFIARNVCVSAAAAHDHTAAVGCKRVLGTRVEFANSISNPSFRSRLQR
jgi:hypothetical protein